MIIALEYLFKFLFFILYPLFFNLIILRFFHYLNDKYDLKI